MRDNLLTIKDLSNILQLSHSAIYRLIQNRKIPFIKISGKAIRFRQDDIEQWLSSKSFSPCTDYSMRKAAVTNLRQRGMTNNHIQRIVDSTRNKILKEVKNV